MTREALKKLNEKQMNYCKTLSALIDRAKIKGLKEENERNRGKLRGFLECMEQMELLSGYEVKGRKYDKEKAGFFTGFRYCNHGRAYRWRYQGKCSGTGRNAYTD